MAGRVFYQPGKEGYELKIQEFISKTMKNKGQ
jgi:hypothetical protein